MGTDADRSEALASRVGLLGELVVEQQLVKEGWHPVRLDTAQMASNADLLAVNRKHRVALQAKTTNADKPNSRAEWLGFGYSTGYLRDKKPVFNSKVSPLVADVVVGVSYRTNSSRFIVMPVAFAEQLCTFHCDFWFSVPTKTEKGIRSQSFPIYLSLATTREAHGAHHDRMKRNLHAFEGAWHILRETVDKLHDPKAWPLFA